MSVPTIQRVTYFNGQRLSAADMTDAQDAARELRWLHNRSLHGWGIASGLSVRGKVGDRSVTIAPGYAIDAHGREIVLGASAVANVPSVVGSTGEVRYFLTAAWIADDNETVLQKRDGACSGSGAIRLSDDPLIAWRSPDELKDGTELVLAEVWIKNCRLNRAISSASRRSARMEQQPYIAAGQTDGTVLDWSIWTSAGQIIGVEAHVDTSEAQFGSTPQYLVQITGERYLASAPGPLVALGFASAANAGPNGFRVQILLPPGTGFINPPAVRDPVHAADVIKALGWQVTWIGVEN